MTKISAVITCFNNQETIEKCLASFSFADEIILLDSFSSDKTLEIAKQFDCTIKQQNFKGFWQQKQDAINLARNDWIVLLDSDEYLNSNAQDTIKQWQQCMPKFDAYALPRCEWVFWQWSHKFVHKNKFVRLFNRNKAKVSQDLVHESIKTTGHVSDLNAVIKHFGETSITIKLEKINKYSSLAAQQKFSQGKSVSALKLFLYPIWYFFKQYIIRRQVFNGIAGLVNAYLNSTYAFLKYAKLYELQKNKN